ncbi:hypothetical protein V8C26DRAFT_402575 [Trichoderma gracile]
MAPRRAVADASPSSQRRLRLLEDLPAQRRPIFRQRALRNKRKELQRVKRLLEECMLPAKAETDTNAETDTDADVETRWERSTRGDAKALWVEQLYRYEEL